MTSNKHYDSDEIPELSLHHSGVYDEDQFGKNELKNNSMIELERNQPDGLRRLSREMQACSLTFEQMNYVSDLNSSRTIETMVLKLPTHIQQEWLKVAYKIIRGDREPPFTDLVEVVKEQADIANTRYGLLLYFIDVGGDRTALSESTYGIAEYTCSENVSRQVHCSFLLTEYEVVKPKTEAPSANKSKSTLRKLKEKKYIKLKVKTTKRPKLVAHIRRGIEDGVEKGALIRVVNKSKGASGSSIGANAILRQIMCSWNQNKTVNALLERGCEWRFKLPRAGQRDSVWGRIIKSIRRILRSLLFQKVLMDESSRDLVLVNNVCSPRSLWFKAIVEQVSYGSDGQVRTAKLRTANKETVRGVRRLCLLGGAGCLTATTTTLDNGRGARFGGSAKCDR
ncbi:unnamed protein product [Schistosoma margrebowiei]|uniref:Uncharacterized protein n=1 Tax=Schistosoma margrebowiei TaxID=48269 RepID=A0A183LI95_9TREM|nr:unnamed protein product [Schistosoma margrebowiei]